MPAPRKKTAGGPARPAAAPTGKPKPAAAVPAEEIARLAYSYWEARGRKGGSAEEDWLRAEGELRGRPAAPRKRAKSRQADAE